MRRVAAFALLLCCGVAPAEEARPAPEVHEVAPGDSLSRIALRRVGSTACWREIYRANRDQIKDPALVYPGQRLVIPDLGPCAAEASRRATRD